MLGKKASTDDKKGMEIKLQDSRDSKLQFIMLNTKG
jgi:hypothetical protein